MGEIKFRAWFDRHMYEVAKLDFWGDPEQATCDMAGPGKSGEWEELFDIYVGEVELMQYTGLKDKNGEEIYEGDIVVAWSAGHRAVGEVKQRIDGLWIMYPAYQKGKLWGLCPNPKGETSVEVIGNIYENPELMEAGV